MKICVLGFGHVGSQLARLWTAAGHRLLASLRTCSKHIDAVQKLGIEILEPRLAIQDAEVIALALPWQSVDVALHSLGPLNGQILIDATNPINSDLNVIVPGPGSGGQQIAAWFPKARVVKAFNTIGATYLGNTAFDIYYCSDDPEAAGVTHHLIEDTQMRPVNVGPLKNAAYLEQMAGLWIDLAVKGRIQGPFGFNLVREHGR